jgi:tetratricopeptide (TPR) repeat protein
VFAIQEEISRKIVKALKVQLTDTESRKVAERPIDNPAAYDCYLQAHQEMLRFTPGSLDRAQKLADAGLALVGENPLLLATRGIVSWYYLNFSIRPEERYLDEAASFAARALDQDPEGFLGIYLRGLVAAKRGEAEAAVRDIRRACALKPGNSATLELMRYLHTAGHSSETVLDQSIRIDPLNPLCWNQLGFARFQSGRLEEAEQARRRAFELTGPGSPVRAYTAWLRVLVGRREDAIADFDEVASTLGQTPYGSVSGFLARALQGDAIAATGHVTPLLEQSARWVEYLAWMLADGYALIGRRDEAMRWLGRSVELGLLNYPVLSKLDPLLESLRGDAEYQALMQQVHKRWLAFDA